MRSEPVFTNFRCNQNCTYCTSRRPTDVLAQIRPDAVRAATLAQIAAGARAIVLTGGEPTMRRDLPELVAHAVAAGAEQVVLETNATLIDDGLAQALAGAGLSLARVNLSGWGDELDAVTRDPGGFTRALAGMRALAAAGLPVEVQAAVVRGTRPMLPDLPEKLAAALGSAEAVRLLRVVVPIESPDPGELVSFEEAAETILAMEASGRRSGIPVRMSPVPGPPPCVFPPRSRAAHIFSMTRGSVRSGGFVKLEPCAACLVNDRCSGMPEVYLARRPAPPMHPVTEDRARRRLSVISTIKEQVDREFVQPNRILWGEGREVDEDLIRINFHCNQACHFCFVSTHLPGVADERVREAIVSAAERGVKITLSGGEPTLHPRLVDFVRLAKARSALPVELQTNAVRLDNEELARALEEAGLDQVLVSLHAVTAELSDEITAAPGTFARTLAGLDNLGKTRIRMVLNFVICELNYRELPELVRLTAARWPRATVSVSFVAPSSDVVPRDRRLVPRYSDVSPFVAEAIELGARLGVEIAGFESMCGIPLCLVPKGMRDKPLLVIEQGYDRGEFLKVEACRACELDPHCYGVRRGYAEMHGTGEMRAIRR